jgi:hypothetical protein
MGAPRATPTEKTSMHLLHRSERTFAATDKRRGGLPHTVDVLRGVVDRLRLVVLRRAEHRPHVVPCLSDRLQLQT